MAKPGTKPKFGDVIFRNEHWLLTWTGKHGAPSPYEVRLEHLKRNRTTTYASLIGGKVIWDYPGDTPKYIHAKAEAALKQKAVLDEKEEYLRRAIRKKYNRAVRMGRIQ